MNYLISVGAIVGIVIGLLFLVLIVWLVGWAVSTYNKLVQARNKVKNQFSQIDVQLKRRFDLIPNLVETVKGFAVHEEKILTSFAQARQMYTVAKGEGDVTGMAQADARVTSGINALLNAVRENYPQIQANSNFQSLMSDLKDTEDKIAYQRQFYNDVVLSYNNFREVFPKSIIANMFNFKEEKYFEAGEESRENVQVKF